METIPSHQQKIDRLEAKGGSLKIASADSSVPPKLPSANGSLVPRSSLAHWSSGTISRYCANSSGRYLHRMPSFCAPCFPRLRRKRPHWPPRRSNRPPMHIGLPSYRRLSKKGEAHLRIAGSPPRRPCAPPVAGEARYREPDTSFFPNSPKPRLLTWRFSIFRSARSAGPKVTAPSRRLPMTRAAN